MSPLPMFTAYKKAAALADTTQQPAIVVSLTACATLDQYDALTAEEYHNDPRAGFFFDVVEPKED